jgi:predicted nucleotidyltransferase component of viral defense system
MTRAPKDVGASVRARLAQRARERGDDFQLVLVRYANERLLYRLAASRHAGHFVLKGAALFTAWVGMPHRATRDLDLLGFGDNTEAHLRAVFVEVLRTTGLDDSVTFDVDGLEVGPIRDDQEYGGLRVTTTARIANARVRVQVDIGFGDAITPGAEDLAFPTLLDFPAPRIRAYPRETVIAEKVEAMVQLGMANSRMKDFFDVLHLAQQFTFEGDLLSRAIRATFDRRRTSLPTGLPVALTPDFADDATKRTQWVAFLRKSGAAMAPPDLPSVIDSLVGFLSRPLAIAASGEAWQSRWAGGGPWSDRG